MKILLRHQLLFAMAISSLLAGTFNYLLLRPDIVLFKITGITATAVSVNNNFMLHFLTGYFSDIVWCIALCCIVIAFEELNYINYSGKLFLLLLPFITEVLQYFKIVQGVFDWFDILTYALVIAFFVFFFPNIKNTIVYEKD